MRRVGAFRARSGDSEVTHVKNVNDSWPEAELLKLIHKLFFDRAVPIVVQFHRASPSILSSE
jgi:hypothetical protein